MQQEVTIHQSLNHKHIVQFFSYFEDENNVYIILELCRRRVNEYSFIVKSD
jgi:polo-like kinase 1